MIRRIQLTLLALFVGVWAMASETSVKNADGVEIWYNFDSNTKTASVTYKGREHYFYKEYIGNVVIPSKVRYEGEEYSVTSIGFGAFYDCISLTSITIPEGVTSIGESAFEYCSSLTSITIPESVTKIGSNAFCYSGSIVSISSMNVTPPSIGNNYTFYGVHKSSPVYVPKQSVEAYESAEYWKDFKNIVGKFLVVTATAENGTVTGAGVYEENAEVTLIATPDEGYTFVKWSDGNTNATREVTVKADATYTAMFAINQHTLTVTSNGNGTVSGSGTYDYGTKVTLKATAEDNYHFVKWSDGNTNATRVVTVNGDATYTATFIASVASVKNADGVEIWYKFDSDKTASVTYKGESFSSFSNEYTGEVVIPSKVTYEGEEYSVTSIRYDAFNGCSTLTSIALPESVTEIGDEAFRNCSSLTSITIPESVTSIGESAFSGCRSLTSITIPKGVTSIQGGAFEVCSSLTSIDVASDNNNYTSIDGVLFSKDKTILIKYPEGKKDVTSYAIHESVTEIERYAFSNCSSLTSITIPEGVKTIGNYAFFGCSILTSITIPEGVISIGEYAFRDCSFLTSITSMNVTPPSIFYSFYRVDKSIPVYVPKHSVEAYKSAEYWEEFTNILGIDDVTPITDVVADSVSIRLIGNSLIVEGAESYAVYALSGQCLGKLESLERGLYIVVADGVSKKIVVK